VSSKPFIIGIIHFKISKFISFSYSAVFFPRYDDYFMSDNVKKLEFEIPAEHADCRDVLNTSVAICDYDMNFVAMILCRKRRDR